MLKNNLISLCIFLSFLKSYGQDIEKYQWENRILLIFSDEKKSDKLLNQMQFLSNKTKGLQDRKLKIFQFSEGEFQVDFNSDWLPSTIKIKKYKRKLEEFKVILIGLDGGVKLRRKDVLSTEKLFAIIDRMPMRRSELKKNRN